MAGAEPDDRVEAARPLRIMSRTDEDTAIQPVQVPRTALTQLKYTTIGMCVIRAVSTSKMAIRQ
jgi:hypothetical protein